MANIVVATLNVSFAEATTSGGDLPFKLEIDDRDDGLNGGETSFEPGDSAGFFLFKDPNVTLVSGPTSTAGGITSVGTGSKIIDENISFSNSNSGTLGYPPSSAVTLAWQGRCYKLVNGTVTTISTLPEQSGSELRIADGSNVIGVLRAQYTTTGSLYRLQAVPVDIAEVQIFAVGSSV